LFSLLFIFNLASGTLKFFHNIWNRSSSNSAYADFSVFHRFLLTAVEFIISIGASSQAFTCSNAATGTTSGAAVLTPVHLAAKKAAHRTTTPAIFRDFLCRRDDR